MRWSSVCLGPLVSHIFKIQSLSKFNKIQLLCRFFANEVRPEIIHHFENKLELEITMNSFQIYVNVKTV